MAAASPKALHAELVQDNMIPPSVSIAASANSYTPKQPLGEAAPHHSEGSSAAGPAGAAGPPVRAPAAAPGPFRADGVGFRLLAAEGAVRREGCVRLRDVASGDLAWGASLRAVTEAVPVTVIITRDQIVMSPPVSSRGARRLLATQRDVWLWP